MSFINEYLGEVPLAYKKLELQGFRETNNCSNCAFSRRFTKNVDSIPKLHCINIEIESIKQAPVVHNYEVCNCWKSRKEEGNERRIYESCNGSTQI